eukprot:11204491-Lingulodinium_polyedra.AAC.1
MGLMNAPRWARLDTALSTPCPCGTVHAHVITRAHPATARAAALALTRMLPQWRQWPVIYQ